MPHRGIALRLTFLPMFFVCFSANSQEADAMAAYFANEKNQHRFEEASRSGTIESVKKRVIEACPSDKAQKYRSTPDCRCLRNELIQVSEREVFYESELRYGEYLASMKALGKGDTKTNAELKERRALRSTYLKRIERKCGKHEPHPLWWTPLWR